MFHVGRVFDRFLGPVIQTKSNLDQGLKQSFYLQVFLEVSCFKELNDFLLCSI